MSKDTEGPAEAPKTASEVAYREIQNAIVTGSLEPGNILTEQELVEMTGVSRTPIREAINRLANEGWVDVESGRKNRKSYVAQFTRDELVELSELRAEIEAFAARRAATLITEIELERLEAIQDNIDAVIRKNSKNLFDQFGVLNQQFHSIIWEAGSRRAARLLSGTLSAPANTARPPRDQTVSHLQRASTYHRSIIAALRRRDSEGSAIQMSAHIHSIIDRL